MKKFESIVRTFVYVVVIIPMVVCHAHGVRSHYAAHVKEHAHKQVSPCDTCPRHGRCVPRVQCPAHLRPGSNNPLCHLDNSAVGVCCITGSDHAAESERITRRSASISAEETKSAHALSRQKLEKYLRSAEEILEHSVHTAVNASSPTYGHHLSVVTYDKRADTLGKGALLNLFTAQELKSRQALLDDDLFLGFTDHTDGKPRTNHPVDSACPFCPPPASCQLPPSRYRSVGGECNNPANADWGAVHTGFERLLPPDYEDGLWSLRTAKSGLPLPSAREVSAALLLEASHPSTTHNLMFMQFGQFIAHDSSAGVVFTTGNSSGISCCMNNGEETLPPELQHFSCAPITITTDDQFFGVFKHTCINFVRGQLAPASDCSVGYAKQMNGATHYPDLSQLYGNSLEKLASLRSPRGLLATFNDYGRDLPPLTDRPECLTSKDGQACFESGDHHGNQIISLTVFHTIWTREHNRVARALSAINPGWDDDTVFMETRRILQAEFQHIIYNEWLPLLLGHQMMQTFGLSPSVSYSSAYDPHVNPSLTAEFSAAAMRFGHSIVDGRILVPVPESGEIYESVSLPELMFQPGRLRLRHFLDRLLVGLGLQPMQTVDPLITEGLTRYMFHGGNPFGLDLASINIQRGRDHGLRSYNEYRRLIGLQPYQDFQQFPISVSKRLSSVYESPEDIDLWVGGLIEEPVEGGIVGVTFANIIADQFSRLKRGDRYFYERGPDVNPGAFTIDQLAELKKVTLSRIVCDNADGIELSTQAPEAFLRADLHGNEPVPCNSPKIPVMDLNKFKDA